MQFCVLALLQMHGWQVRKTCGQPCLSLASFSAIPTLLIVSFQAILAIKQAAS